MENDKKLEALAKELAKGLKTEQDLSTLSRALLKLSLEVTGDLKNIYNSLPVDVAEKALEDFAEKWDGKYPAISRSWRSHWEHLITIFGPCKVFCVTDF